MNRTTLVIVLLCAAGRVAWASGYSYTVTDVGSLVVGRQSVSYGFNSAGEVVGKGFVNSVQYHGFLYCGGTIQGLAAR